MSLRDDEAAAKAVDLAFLEVHLQQQVRPITKASFTQQPHLGGWSPRIEGAFNRLLAQISLAQLGPLGLMVEQLGNDIDNDDEQRLGAALEQMVRA